MLAYRRSCCDSRGMFGCVSCVAIIVLGAWCVFLQTSRHKLHHFSSADLSLLGVVSLTASISNTAYSSASADAVQLRTPLSTPLDAAPKPSTTRSDVRGDNTSFQAMNIMPAYSKYSLQELRWKHYAANLVPPAVALPSDAAVASAVVTLAAGTPGSDDAAVLFAMDDEIAVSFHAKHCSVK